MAEPQYWLVGASLDGEDRTDDMVKAGKWELWPDPDNPDQHRDQVEAMRPGDGIAIKAAYTRKLGLPFENHGHTVSVLGIKAVGTITANPGDGRSVEVEWHQRHTPPREWYFFTKRDTIWKPDPNRTWYARDLIDFVFNGQEQDIRSFRNDPFWRDRFGDVTATEARFGWTHFYQRFADRLAAFRDRRKELVDGLADLIRDPQVPYLDYLAEPTETGERKPPEDIDPFTLMGAFNRGITNDNRRLIAGALGRLLGVDAEPPEAFAGIPILNNQRSWFFAFRNQREPEAIENLWAVFEAALTYADSSTGEREGRETLTHAYDQVIQQRSVGWNLTMGLYWVRPWHFVPLDGPSRQYLRQFPKLSSVLPNDYSDLSGLAYLDLVETIEADMAEGQLPVGSIPALSLAAWDFQPGDKGVEPDGHEPEYPQESPAGDEAVAPAPPYELATIREEGGFFPLSFLERMRDRLHAKKNIILQGPPGTGKTWLAKRLAHAVVGFQSAETVHALQFHPTLSYEDFVRGWRPGPNGQLELVDGPFMQAVQAAHQDDRPHVVVVEEINRGNPAQVLGEILTLMEGDKRAPEHALRLSHMREGEAPVFLPPNLYLIGTMNIADRSLALVDLALRRRFAFFDLEPQLNDDWVHWLHRQAGVAGDAAHEIGSRLRQLNKTISSDKGLGPNFQIGHSFVTPAPGQSIPDPRAWFEEVVETEIRPLLEEYWFDQPQKAQEAADQLLAGWTA